MFSILVRFKRLESRGYVISTVDYEFDGSELCEVRGCYGENSMIFDTEDELREAVAKVHKLAEEERMTWHEPETVTFAFIIEELDD